MVNYDVVEDEARLEDTYSLWPSKAHDCRYLSENMEAGSLFIPWLY